MSLPLIAIIVVVAAIAAVVLLRGGAKAPSQPAPAAAPRKPRPLTTPDAPLPPQAPAPEMPAELATLVLVDDADLPLERLQQIATALQAITLPSPSLREVLSPQFLEDGSAKELSEIIMREPLVATRVLAVVNSPLYGLHSPIVSVAHAVNYLGLNAVRGIVTSVLMEQSFTSEDPELRKIHARLWNAATIASELAYQLAPRLDIGNRGVVATQALLSFIGHFALLALLPAEGGAVLRDPLLQRIRTAQQRIGLHEGFLGALLLRGWGLPAALVEGVRDSARIVVAAPGTLPAANAPAAVLCHACVRIAERVIFEDLRDLSTLDLMAEDLAETFQLRAWLARPEFALFTEHLQSPDLRKTVGRQVEAAGAR